jgi:hypothetical protein
MDDWPFDQPPNCAVISLRQIVVESAPILHVSHDDDHGWQFLGLEDAREEDACVVSLANMIRLDPSIRDLADLPPGWHAWRRAVGAAWSREPNPDEIA